MTCTVLEGSRFKRSIIVALITAYFCCSGNAQAWDGHRKGFVLGLGLGQSLVNYEKNYRNYASRTTVSERKTISLLNTDFRIGFAPTDVWEVYYFSKVHWSSTEETYGMRGIGLSRVFKPEAPSLLVSCGIGYAASSSHSLQGGDTTPGFGLFVGGGYEFVRHWKVELNLSQTRPGHALAVVLAVCVSGY